MFVVGEGKCVAIYEGEKTLVDRRWRRGFERDSKAFSEGG
jgi:hypothetical protein